METVKEKILIVAAHPDDELLGCAGAIAYHLERGDEIEVIIMAEGITSRSMAEGISNNQLLDELKRQSTDAANILGLEQGPEFYNLPDNRMDSIDLLDIVKIIENKIDSFRATTVYTHHYGDLNIDHRLTYEAVLTATRPMPGTCVRNIYTFETVSSTEWGITNKTNSFIPSRYIDISHYINKKLQALACYKDEMREHPHARSLENVKNLAAFRGASIGCKYAEAYCVVREILGSSD